MEAMTDLAIMYRDGEGVKKDLAAHFQWAKRAAAPRRRVWVDFGGRCPLER